MADIVLGPKQNIWLYYDPDREAWTSFVTGHNSGGLSGGLGAAANESITGQWTFSGLDRLGLNLLDTDESHALGIVVGSNLTAARALTLTTGDAARTLTLNGNPTLDDWFDQSVKVAATPTFGATTITGALTISGASAGQIVFPATQNASSNANTLDDYEEGTWTPSVGGNATYTTQLGTYQRIGNHVFCNFFVEINTLGTGSTNSLVGLPFTTAANHAGLVGYFASLAVNTYFVGMYTGVGGTDLVFTGQDALDGTVVNSLALFGNSAAVIGCVQYRI